jgi:hypothetical protein
LISKGEFAYDIVAAIEADDETAFCCPDYFTQAVEEVLTDREVHSAV